MHFNWVVCHLGKWIYLFFYAKKEDLDENVLDSPLSVKEDSELNSKTGRDGR